MKTNPKTTMLLSESFKQKRRQFFIKTGNFRCLSITSFSTIIKLDAEKLYILQKTINS